MKKKCSISLTVLIFGMNIVVCNNESLEKIKQSLRDNPQRVLEDLKQKNLSAQQNKEIRTEALNIRQDLLKQKQKREKEFYKGYLSPIRSEQRYIANMPAAATIVAGIIAYYQESGIAALFAGILAGISGKMHYDIAQAEKKDKPLNERIKALQEISALLKENSPANNVPQEPQKVATKPEQKPESKPVAVRIQPAPTPAEKKSFEIYGI